MTQKIKIVSQLTPHALLPFSIELKNVPMDDEYILDFQNVGLAEPFGMVFLAAIIRQFMRSRRDVQGKDFRVLVENYKKHSYPSYMGLFKSFGLDHGNEPGEAGGSGTYIPITRLPIRRIIRDAREDYVQSADIVEKEARKISAVLTRGDPGPITETLSYAIQELMRNVVEHANTTHIWYAAQYWPTRNRVEVAILDEGVGLLASLRRNPNVDPKNHIEAISLSLEKGISGTRTPNRKTDGHWSNTGYGLFMTSSLCKAGGDFLICNYSHALMLTSQTTTLLECAYTGLAVRMVLDTSRIQNLNSTLAMFR